MAELETTGAVAPATQSAASTEVTETSAPQVSPQTTESSPKQGLEANANPTPQEIADWKKDGRYGKVWKNENDLYKSYRSIEKMYEPLKKQYDNYDNKFKTLGIEPDALDEIMTEYKTFKDPKNPMVAKANFLDEWTSNPLYATKVESFFNDLYTQEIQRRFPSWTAEQIQQQLEMEERYGKLEEYIQKQEQEKEKTEYLQEIDSALDRIKKVSEAKGFQYTQEIENKLLDHCMKTKDRFGNPIPSKYMYHVFLDLYGDELDKNFSTIQEKRVLEKLNSNQKKGVIMGATNSNNNVAPKQKLSFREKYNNIRERISTK